MGYKKLLVLLLIVTLAIPVAAKKRNEKILKLTDLTQVDSPAYVPYPYPDTDQKVIDDLKYVIKKLYMPHANSFESSGQKMPTVDNFLPKLLKKNSSVKIKSILKVKNRIAAMPDDFTFLIELFDTDTKNNARVALQANGLLFGSLFSTEKGKVRDLKSKKQVIAVFEAKKQFVADEIQTTEWVAYDLMMDNPFYPLCEVRLKNGSTYYLDKMDIPYRKASEVSIADEKEMLRVDGPPMGSPGEKIIIDSITEKRIALIAL